MIALGGGRAAGVGVGGGLARPRPARAPSTCSAASGITVGFHRHFTHKSFKAKPWLRVVMAITGSLAVQGNVLHWVADHRRHHAFSDREGDPHSPWLFGTSPLARRQGFLARAHGLAVRPGRDQPPRFVPDLLADRAIVRVSRSFGMLGRAEPAAAGRARRADHLVVVGRADRVLLGRAGADWRSAPRHLVDQLDLPHARRAAVRDPGQVAQLLAAGGAVDGRVLAQPAPRRPHLRPARRAARPDRHLGAADLDLREARLGARRPLADDPPAGPARQQPAEPGTAVHPDDPTLCAEDEFRPVAARSRTTGAFRP